MFLQPKGMFLFGRSFEQQQITRGREGLPEERWAGSSYGNRGWCRHQQLRAPSLAAGKLLLDRYHSSASWMEPRAPSSDESELCFDSPEKLNQSYLGRGEAGIEGNKNVK